MTTIDKIAFIRRTREEVMRAAERVISTRMEEYSQTFGWDKQVDDWLWDGMGDCGVGYSIAVGNVTETSRQMRKDAIEKHHIGVKIDGVWHVECVDGDD